jgi:hypothetical protein
MNCCQIQYKDKDGKLRPKRESAEFRGTTLYASPFIHKGDDQCPRDDLYSLMFVLCDLICGRLPWSEAARSKDKQTVAHLKEEYLEQPQKFIEWIASNVAAAEAVRDSFSVSVTECSNVYPSIFNDIIDSGLTPLVVVFQFLCSILNHRVMAAQALYPLPWVRRPISQRVCDR